MDNSLEIGVEKFSLVWVEEKREGDILIHLEMSELNEIHVSSNRDTFSLFVHEANDVAQKVMEAFPEVPPKESIFDFGVSSFDLLNRVSHLEDRGLPVSIVDVFDLHSPLELSLRITQRALEEGGSDVDL
uniref:phosphopantetheine-binding protein n=1 Tax=Corynebacterium casei TaxID=160386 RepID=UPI000BF18650|nr:phosphopantetheine-binding protein [Corynebacterium casei]